MKDIIPHSSVVIAFLLLWMTPSCEIQKTRYIETLSGKEITASDLDSYLEAHMDSLHIQGISIAVINNAKIVYHRGTGTANIYSLESVNNRTIFETASISKFVSIPVQ